MAVIAGEAPWRYEFIENWAKLPRGADFHEVAAVAVDSRDRVFVFSRGNRPMMVFEADGSFLTSWGEGMFTRPHGLHIGHDNAIYCTDHGDHTVRKFTLDGKLEMMIGVPGESAPMMSGEPLNNCTHTALSPQGHIYVSDGYGNAKVHKYTPDGKLLFSWGEQGCLPGQFHIPHNICCDRHGMVYVADRENNRIQLFDEQGNYLRQWNNMVRPNGLHIVEGDEPLFFVAEGGPSIDQDRFPYRNLGPRISILDSKGNFLARIGEGNPGVGPGQFVAPHGISVDSRGDIYVGEVACVGWPVVFPAHPVPSDVPVLRKLRRVRD